MGYPEGEYDFVVKSAKHTLGKFGPQLELQLETVPEDSGARPFGFKLWFDTDTKHDGKLKDRAAFLVSVGLKEFDWLDPNPEKLSGLYGRAKLWNKVNANTGEVGKYLSVKEFTTPLAPAGLKVDPPPSKVVLRPGDAGYLDSVKPWDSARDDDVPF